MAELKKKAGLDVETIEETRVYLVHSGKIQKELGADYPVTSILDYTTLVAERLPKEDLEITEGDRTVYAFHFDKEPAKTHGIPFKFQLKPVSGSCSVRSLPLTEAE